MNKKLIALAVSAVAAAAASAQTANVTLYGVMDSYLINVRANHGGKSVTALDAGGLSGSRWGLRGSEALGGGLNAVFTIESGINSDVGSSAQGGLLFGRQAFVGLNGGFGSLTMGRQYSPLFYVGANSDVDGYSNFSAPTNQMLLQSAGTQLRINNSVTYKTPNMGGLTAQAQWAFGESAAGTSAGRILGANVEYSNGPIYAGLGYADGKNAAGTTTARSWIVGGSFNAGVATIGADYWQWKNPAVANTKATSYALGATVPLGAFALIGQIGQLKQNAAKQTLIMFGGDYTLSKRTNLYARYVNGNNNGSSGFDVPGIGGAVGSGTGGALLAGQDKTGLAIGMRHRF